MEKLRIEKIKNQPTTGPWKHGILIPYKNKWGHFVWRTEGDLIDLAWPGFKAPKWAKDLICFDNIWYWAAEE